MGSVGKKTRASTNKSKAWNQLLLRSQQGDAIAFRRLYVAFSPVVRAFLLSRRLSVHAADDVLQEVFCRVWQGRSRYSGPPASASTYLLAIAMNVSRELTRNQ